MTIQEARFGAAEYEYLINRYFAKKKFFCRV